MIQYWYYSKTGCDGMGMCCKKKDTDEGRYSLMRLLFARWRLVARVNDGCQGRVIRKQYAVQRQIWVIYNARGYERWLQNILNIR